jgi:hypothetical protein
MGRNIKYILDESVASQHDSYLARYKETRVKRVVGVPRTITTIHRDQSVMPVEIQVTEIINADGNSYVGRVRHVAIDERVDKEFIANLYINTGRKEEDHLSLEERINSIKSLTGSKAGLDSKAGSKMNVAGSRTASQMNVTQSGNIAQDIDEDSEVTSSSDSDESEEDDMAAGVDTKLRAIKDSEVEDPSIFRLGRLLNFTFVFFFVTLISAFIASNTVQNPFQHFVFLDELAQEALLINEIIFSAKMMYLQQVNNRILTEKIIPANASNPFWECSLNKDYVRPNGLPVLKECEFSKKFNYTKYMSEFLGDLKEAQLWFTNNYLSIRSPGDELDSVYANPFQFKEYTSGKGGPATLIEAPTWADFVAKIIDAVEKITTQPDLVNNTESRLDYQFIESNREIAVDRLEEIKDALFEKVRSILRTEVLVHLIFAIIFVVGAGSLFFFVYIPNIRQIQAERLLILKLLLLVPKSVVWDFVYMIYRDAEDEDEEGLEDDFDEDGKSRTGQAAKDAAKAKAMKMKSEESVEILNDNAYGLYLFYGIGLFSIVVPLIIHVAWRYAFNAEWFVNLYYYYDTVSLFTSINALLWRSAALWYPTEYALTEDIPYTLPLRNATMDIRYSADKVFFSFHFFL